MTHWDHILRRPIVLALIGVVAFTGVLHWMSHVSEDGPYDRVLANAQVCRSDSASDGRADADHHLETPASAARQSGHTRPGESSKTPQNPKRKHPWHKHDCPICLSLGFVNVPPADAHDSLWLSTDDGAWTTPISVQVVALGVNRQIRPRDPPAERA